MLSTSANELMQLSEFGMPARSVCVCSVGDCPVRGSTNNESFLYATADVVWSCEREVVSVVSADEVVSEDREDDVYVCVMREGGRLRLSAAMGENCG